MTSWSWACEPGGAGLAAAERVGPDGHVVLSDVVPAMTTIAAARAAERGLSNVSTATIDFESISTPPMQATTSCSVVRD